MHMNPHTSNGIEQVVTKVVFLDFLFSFRPLSGLVGYKEGRTIDLKFQDAWVYFCLKKEQLLLLQEPLKNEIKVVFSLTISPSVIFQRISH